MKYLRRRSRREKGGPHRAGSRIGAKSGQNQGKHQFNGFKKEKKDKALSRKTSDQKIKVKKQK